ncbi:MAG TPA: DMT family transporter [Candidatus Saccharimonadales bacterium]|nr:DMT family transporter [Candidatus Saccharimonadales bacterium]
MSWLVLTFLAVSSRAVYGIASKVFSNLLPVSPITQSVILTLFASILTLLINPLVGGISFKHFQSVWVIAVIMTLSQAIGLILYFKGVEKLQASITQIAFSSIVIWGAFLSTMLLGSHFTWVQLLGVLALIGAIILIQYRKGQLKPSLPMVYIFISAGCFAIFQVTSAQLSRVMTAGTYSFLAYFGSAIFIYLLYAKKVTKELPILFRSIRSVLSVSIFASGTSLLYFLFAYFAYSQAPDRGIVVLLLTTQVIVAVFLGIIFLKEKDRMLQKIIAGILAVIASILIKA